MAVWKKTKHSSKRLHRGTGGTGKTAVFGMIERAGKVIATVVPNTQSATLLPKVVERVLPRSPVFTDEYVSYGPLAGHGYRHSCVHHGKGVYVSGDAHVNTIEGFWSLTKNGIRGVYHNVSAKYLQMYLNEYAFRFNRRKNLGLEQPMFDAFVSRIQKAG